MFTAWIYMAKHGKTFSIIDIFPDYMIIIELSHVSHGLFFPILLARSRSVDELRHLWLHIGRNS